MKETTKDILVSQTSSKRLDQWLSDHFSDHSRSYFQKLIEGSKVLLNGAPTKKQHKLEEGDQLEIQFEDPPQLDIHPEDIPLDILFEDEHLIAINKPSGMVVHPAPGAYTGTFAAALLHHCKTLNPADFEAMRPGIVHRLDKETTGVLVAAKTLAAHQKLTHQFAERTARKRYLAICCNTPPEGRYSAPIKRHPVKRKEMRVDEEGKEAISSFSVKRKNGELSFVEVEIHTGRTHQIRVHLKHLGAPVLGDPVYGNPNQNKKHGANRQLLHAEYLKISHPHTGEPLELTAPIPSDMKIFIEQIELA